MSYRLLRFCSYYFICLFLVVIFSSHAQPTVYVIGDSHAMFSFSNKTVLMPGEQSNFLYEHKGNKMEFPFSIHRLGSTTMHRIGRDGLAFLDIRKVGVKEGDVVVFVFGEIDVRCHIGKQRDTQRRSLDEIVDTLVKNYIATIVANKRLYRDVVCVVFNIIPPTNGVFNSEYPYYGPLEDRISIAKHLNAKLKKCCSKAGILFLDIYDMYSNAQGSLRYELSDGSVHIAPTHNRPVKEKLLGLMM